MSTQLPVCHLITTGGTIAMKVDPVKQAPVPALSGQDLVEQVPLLAQVCWVSVVNLFNEPSVNIGVEHWSKLLEAVEASLGQADVAGVVISHGTDTLEETAWFLDLTLKTDKPVVIVGAQRNASTYDFDGPRNLLNAARVCVSPESRGLGVLVAMNNQVNAAREVTKSHTSDVESFKSGDFGFLGSVDEESVRISRKSLRRQHIPLLGSELPRVEIVTMFSGASGDLVDAAVGLGVRGLVIQALGIGNVSGSMYRAIVSAVEKGVAVAVSTRVQNGRVLPVYGFVGGGATLKTAGVVFADNLSPQKTRVLLMLALQHGIQTAESLQELFDR